MSGNLQSHIYFDRPGSKSCRNRSTNWVNQEPQAGIYIPAVENTDS